MTVPSATSVGKQARFVSRMGEKCERYVSHTRDVKSSKNIGGQCELLLDCDDDSDDCEDDSAMFSG